jgi:hypothetical protein
MKCSLGVHPFAEPPEFTRLLRHIAVSVFTLKFNESLKILFPSIPYDEPPNEANFIKSFAALNDDWLVLFLSSALIPNPG